MEIILHAIFEILLEVGIEILFELGCHNLTEPYWKKSLIHTLYL